MFTPSPKQSGLVSNSKTNNFVLLYFDAIKNDQTSLYVGLNIPKYAVLIFGPNNPDLIRT